jgi:hypothetical protein
MDASKDKVLAMRVAKRYAATFYKEKPETKRNRIMEMIRGVGVSGGVAKDIADKMVAKHGDIGEILRLALQKGWPVDQDGTLKGPKGTLDLSAVPV